MIRKIVETSEISTQAGRAPFFLIFDESGGLIEILGRR